MKREQYQGWIEHHAVHRKLPVNSRVKHRRINPFVRSARGAEDPDSAEAKQEKTAALDAVRRGDMSKFQAWNRANPDDRITQEQALKIKAGQSAQSVLGVKVTKKKIKDPLKEFQHAYQ